MNIFTNCWIIGYIQVSKELSFVVVMDGISLYYHFKNVSLIVWIFLMRLHCSISKIIVFFYITYFLLLYLAELVVLLANGYTNWSWVPICRRFTQCMCHQPFLFKPNSAILKPKGFIFLIRLQLQDPSHLTCRVKNVTRSFYHSPFMWLLFIADLQPLACCQSFT